MQDKPRQPTDALIGTAGDHHDTDDFEELCGKAGGPRRNRYVPEEPSLLDVAHARLLEAAGFFAHRLRRHGQNCSLSGAGGRTQKNHAGLLCSDAITQAGAGEQSVHAGFVSAYRKITYTIKLKNYTLTQLFVVRRSGLLFVS